MIINISNCNNIDQRSLSMIENTLNIRYVITGTKKSIFSNAVLDVVCRRQC
jgi:hypothetical protein